MNYLEKDSEEFVDEKVVDMNDEEDVDMNDDRDDGFFVSLYFSFKQKLIILPFGKSLFFLFLKNCIFVSKKIQKSCWCSN